MAKVPSPGSVWHSAEMSRAIAPLLLLSLVLSLATQGCSCSSNGPTRDGGGGGDEDASTGDNGVSQDNGPVDMNRPDVPPFVPPDVHVIITADNAYGFGYGSDSALVDYFEGVEDGGDNIFVCSAECDENTPCANAVECDDFGTCNDDRRGPETYIVPGNLTNRDGYLYVVVWSDESVTQGLIGQFSASDGSSPAVYTGSPDWEVCATGMDIDPSGADPTVELINSQIAACNQGAAGTSFSDGWIGDGLENNPSGVMELTVLSDVSMEPPQFANLCQAEDNSDPDRTGDSIDAEARWMWFDENNTDATGAFTSNGQPRGDFLIFRLPVDTVIIFD